MSAPPPYRFPGMDPWLESPGLWPGVHDRLIIYLADDLNARISPACVAVPGGRLVVEEPLLVSIPPEPRRQTFVEIRDTRAGNTVVTIIEVLSLSNKTPGQDARSQYLRKQEEILAGDVHLVEIDLLRDGEHTVALPAPSLPPSPYCVAIPRANDKVKGWIYPIALPGPLPTIPIPLRVGDDDAGADLQALLEEVYREGRYGDLIDYGAPPEPRLAEAEERWAREVLAGAGGRG
ncbi:MAG: DUF4058 family protein [Planctomycetes bacterium]|nr:DUF4058 family protein [Planctomycetota bacterium]